MAAAKALAATDRPEPGGPVNSQAWVMAPVPDAADASSSTTSSWPASLANTAPAEVIRVVPSLSWHRHGSSPAVHSVADRREAPGDLLGRQRHRVRPHLPDPFLDRAAEVSPGRGRGEHKKWVG